ncbi:MAG: hypothetical protein COV74_02225 [Candidatus Omnitrophica bacterium CG11_big_fil_rev_8_21_14_0_20_45_26]|uniref:Uncharacterized protein n=1 Tax=Candidatus Abzuiibacterium crystallinum TaxID=1974748 RepID=A0A2H0LRS7_9BACT|nr:MAG: hypothetical protein COV74_02225 [Candidatus Omnitrophica bacterium CG11_big_fil_rev_8_21_14_0_20_45_26]
MSIKSIVTVVVVVMLIFLAVRLYNNSSHRTGLGRSLDKATDNIQEGVKDAKRSVQDALD